MNGETSFLTKLRHLLLGTAAGAAGCTLLLVLFSMVFVGLKKIPQAALVPLTVFAAAAGAFVAGLVSGILSGHHGLLYGLACGLLLFLILFVCGLALAGDELTGITFLKLGLMLLLGMLGGVLGVNRRLKY